MIFKKLMEGFATNVAKTEAAPADPVGVRRHRENDKELSQNPGEALRASAS